MVVNYTAPAMLLCSSVRCMTFWCVCNIDHICKTSNEPHPLCGQQTYLAMPMYICKFQGNPTCTFSKPSSLVKLIFTRSTQLFSAKGIFCLYKGGMLIGADSKTLLRKLAHSGHLCSYLTGGPSAVGIAHPE